MSNILGGPVWVVATKPCHNCRRRRLRCDRSQPGCIKCTMSGQVCLGYDKTFTWSHDGFSELSGEANAQGEFHHDGQLGWMSGSSAWFDPAVFDTSVTLDFMNGMQPLLPFGQWNPIEQSIGENGVAAAGNIGVDIQPEITMGSAYDIVTAGIVTAHSGDNATKRARISPFPGTPNPHSPGAPPLNQQGQRVAPWLEGLPTVRRRETRRTRYHGRQTVAHPSYEVEFDTHTPAVGYGPSPQVIVPADVPDMAFSSNAQDPPHLPNPEAQPSTTSADPPNRETGRTPCSCAANHSRICFQCANLTHSEVRFFVPNPAFSSEGIEYHVQRILYGVLLGDIELGWISGPSLERLLQLLIRYGRGSLVLLVLRRLKKRLGMLLPLRYRGQETLYPLYLGLVDPVFSNLMWYERFYLFYFSCIVCTDLVAYDGPKLDNPFRDIMRLVLRYPVVMHAAVAFSSLHYSNASLPPMISALNLTRISASLETYRKANHNAERAHIHALAAKSRTYSALRKMLGEGVPPPSVLRPLQLLCANFEIIDTESQAAWRVHLDACIGMFGQSGGSVPSPELDPTQRSLATYTSSDLLIYIVLGSTLTPQGLTSPAAAFAHNHIPILEDAETNNYLCCPPGILSIIITASDLSNRIYNGMYEGAHRQIAIDKALELLNSALDFNIDEWASRVTGNSNHPDDRQIRSRVGCAHRSAACLYILQAVPFARADSPVEARTLVEEIHMQLSRVPRRHALFKATSWPTFMAGAETDSARIQRWATARLSAMWEHCPWGYVVAALELLPEACKAQDESRRSGDEAQIGWLKARSVRSKPCLIV